MKAFSAKQESELIELLWDYLKKSNKHKDRKVTGLGIKTKLGLLSSIQAIVYEEEIGNPFTELKMAVEKYLTITKPL